MEAENSESEDEFSLIDISKEIREQDDYEYLAIMDAIESVLTEEEFQIFLRHLQGIKIADIQKEFNLTRLERIRVFNEIDTKLKEALDLRKTIFQRQRRKPGGGRKRKSS